MEKFSVLPTNKDFRKLTTNQIEFIAYNMQQDAKELAQARSGKEGTGSFSDEDTSWWDNPEADVKRPQDDEKGIATQVDNLTSQEDKKKLAEKWFGVEEIEAFRKQGGTTIEEDLMEQMMQRKYQELFKEADTIASKGQSNWGKTKEEREALGQDVPVTYKELSQDKFDKALEIFNQSKGDNLEENKGNPSMIVDDNDDDYI